MNKKKLLSLFCAVFLLTSTVPVTTAHAIDLSVFTKDKKEAKPPQIEVAADDFIVEQNSKFDLAKALQLKVTDETDGDITSEVTLPEIDYSKLGQQSFNIRVTDSSNLDANKQIDLTVIGIKAPVYVPKFSEIDSMDFNNLIEDPSGTVKATLKSKDDANNKIVIDITNQAGGKLEKTIDVVVQSSNPSATPSVVKESNAKYLEDKPNEVKPVETSSKSEEKNNVDTVKPTSEKKENNSEQSEDKKDTLPKTGDMGFNSLFAFGILGFIGALAMLYFGAGHFHK